MATGLCLGCSSALAARSPGADLAVAPDTVTVAYGRMPRARLTESVESVTSKQIESARAMRVEDLFQGRMAGVQVSRTGLGQLSIRIRGLATLVAGAGEPLIVLDGMPLRNAGGSALDGIAPYDIARLDVLKDAAATAAYGVQGANGVILVTTKRGLASSEP
jgi:iron complex outermembrane receptor protein